MSHSVSQSRNAPVERSYSVTEQECLVIVFVLKKVCMYLDGATSTIKRDYQALASFENLKNPAGCLRTTSIFVSAVQLRD